MSCLYNACLLGRLINITICYKLIIAYKSYLHVSVMFQFKRFTALYIYIHTYTCICKIYVMFLTVDNILYIE